MAGNRALILKASKAPVTAKLLHLNFLSQDLFFRSGTQPKLKEVSSPSFLIPQDEGVEAWKGLIQALSAPKLDRNSARELFKDDSLHYMSASVLKDEYAARCHLLEVISASSAAEAVSDRHDDIKSMMAPIIKYLTKPLMDAQFRWFEAKLACRKAALYSADRSRPWTQALLCSNMWSGGLFDSVEVEKLLMHCKSTNRLLSSVLGSFKKRSYLSPSTRKSSQASYHNRSSSFSKRSPDGRGPSSKKQKTSIQSTDSQPSTSRGGFPNNRGRGRSRHSKPFRGHRRDRKSENNQHSADPVPSTQQQQ